MKLLQLKVAPVATYGLENIWIHLRVKQLENIQKIKATFLKRVLSVSMYTPSLLCYELTREPYFLEKLMLQLLLSTTPAYVECLRSLQSKKNCIWEDFYSTDVMVNREWTQSRYELRHMMTRLSVHGFHFKLCKTKKFHELEPECICERCENYCERCHVMFCKL
jgi:hypothetical protein